METPKLTLEHSEALDQLATSLSQLQGELPHVAKDSKGYGYNYSSLSDTLDTVKPLLAKYGFSITQFEDGTDNLITMLLHKSGQYIKGRMKLISIGMKGANEAQQKGAVLSYFRRYSIQAILGMAAEDSDGASKKDDSPKFTASAKADDRSATPRTETKPATEASVKAENLGTTGTATTVSKGPEVAPGLGKRSFRTPKTGSEDVQ